MVSCRLSRQTFCVARFEAHEWSRLSGRFVDWFQDLPKQFWRVWSNKKPNGFDILLVVLVGSKKTMKCQEEEFYACAMAGLTRILYGRERGNLRYARLGLIKWPMYGPRKTLRGKVPVRLQGLALRFAVNVDFSIFEQIFGLKVDDQ